MTPMDLIIWWTGAVVLTVGAAFFIVGILTAVVGLVDELMAWLAAGEKE